MGLIGSPDSRSGDDWGEALVEVGLLDQLSLSRARRAAAEGTARLDQVLLELGLIDEDSLLAFLAERVGLPMAQMTDFSTESVPELRAQTDFLQRSGAAPVRIENGALMLAQSDPFDTQLAETLAFQLEMPVRRVLATKRTVQAVLARDYSDATAEQGFDAGDMATDDLERMRSLANEGPVIKLVNEVVAAAIDARASDIHVEAGETQLSVRFRVDGTLVNHRTIGGELSDASVSRLKVMAGVNISERRRPQDGRIRMAVRGRNIDFRMSTLPTQFGESIVLRVLDQSQLALDWDKLGFDEGMAARVEHLTGRPHGLFLVCGPTGSGKTTTLYTALSKLDAARRKIFTVEDPIEFSLPGINQVQVRPDLDLTFGAALRAILRQDPDVVLIGEIRDEETAEIAIRAALMGRMVLSTVHTNSAIGAIDRLVNLGVPPFLLGPTLRGVLSQRLVRRVCESCAQPDTDAPAQVPPHLRAGSEDLDGFVRATGCAECGGSGYRGRIVVPELLEPDRKVAELIGSGAPGADLEEAAKSTGLKTIGEAGMAMAAEGQTTLQEVFKVADW